MKAKVKIKSTEARVKLSPPEGVKVTDLYEEEVTVSSGDIVDLKLPSFSGSAYAPHGLEGTYPLKVVNITEEGLELEILKRGIDVLSDKGTLDLIEDTKGKRALLKPEKELKFRTQTFDSGVSWHLTLQGLISE